MSIQFNKKDNYDINDLIKVMEILRDEKNGSPWDKAQTHKSLRKYMLEEAYEVAEAIDMGNTEFLCEELGDVIFQVVYHSQIEKEINGFSFDDVCDGICKKLIRRNPKIFGSDAENFNLNNWDDIKRAEKSQTSFTDTLNGVSKSFPALMRSQKLQQRADKIGFNKKTSKECLDNLRTTIDVLEDRLNKNVSNVSVDIGSLLFKMVELAKNLGVDAEECLYGENERFIQNIATFEKCVEASEKDISTLSNEELCNFYKIAVEKND